MKEYTKEYLKELIKLKIISQIVGVKIPNTREMMIIDSLHQLLLQESAINWC